MDKVKRNGQSGGDQGDRGDRGVGLRDGALFSLALAWTWSSGVAMYWPSINFQITTLCKFQHVSPGDASGLGVPHHSLKEHFNCVQPNICFIETKQL